MVNNPVIDPVTRPAILHFEKFINQLEWSIEMQNRIPPDEAGLPLIEAIFRATGRRPHLSTAMRWCQSRNRYGQRLESWMLGGRRVTSVEAVRRYNERSTIASDSEQGIPVATRHQKSAAHKAAKRELAEMGV